MCCGLGEDVALPQLGHALVELGHARETAAQHDGVRVEDVDDPGQRARQPVAIELHVLGGLGIAGERRLGDVGGAQAAAGALLELTLQAGPAQPGLDAAGAAAVAARAGPLVVARQGQRIVAPFAGDRLRAGERPAVDHHAAAHAGAQDDAEHDAAAGGRAIARFGNGKAVGVVGQAHLAAQPALEVGLERPAVQARRVGVLHQAGGRRDRAGMGDADRAARARLALELGDQIDDRLDVFLVGAGRRRHAQALAFDAAFVEHQALDFGTAEIDADSHGLSSQKTRADVEAARRRRPSRTKRPATRLRPRARDRTGASGIPARC